MFCVKGTTQFWPTRLNGVRVHKYTGSSIWTQYNCNPNPLSILPVNPRAPKSSRQIWLCTISFMHHARLLSYNGSQLSINIFSPPLCASNLIQAQNLQDIHAPRKDPDPKCNLPMCFRNAAWPTVILQHFVSFSIFFYFDQPRLCTCDNLYWATITRGSGSYYNIFNIIIFTAKPITQWPHLQKDMTKYWQSE